MMAHDGLTSASRPHGLLRNLAPDHQCMDGQPAEGEDGVGHRCPVVRGQGDVAAGCGEIITPSLSLFAISLPQAKASLA